MSIKPFNIFGICVALTGMNLILFSSFYQNNVILFIFSITVGSIGSVLCVLMLAEILNLITMNRTA